MTDTLLNLFSTYLIETMTCLLGVALVFRWFAYKSSRYDQVYFTTFTREVELNLDKDKEDAIKIDDVDEYLSGLLKRVGRKLPDRSLRFNQKKKQEKADENGHRVVSLRDFVHGKQNLIFNIQNESSVFKCPHPPNFMEVTNRIMSQDSNWTKLFGVIPIDGIIRMIDILPGLFIVFGVFGTFIGISQALPQIANLDFNNLDSSASVLSQFVLQVTFAMKTSIFGIFFSLILTFLNTLFPIKTVRNMIFKRVENCMEYLWYNIQGEGGHDRELAHILPKLHDVLEKLYKKGA